MQAGTLSKGDNCSRNGCGSLIGLRHEATASKRLDEVIRPGSRVFIGGGASVPFALVESMLSMAAGFKDVELVHIHGLGETPWIAPKYEQVLRTNSFYLTPALRDAVERGQADYTPCAMSELASLFKTGPLPLDVALIQVSPPDAEGFCSLGVSVDIVMSAVKCARVVIAQVNPKMPRTCGDTLVSTRKIGWFIERAAALPEAEVGIFDERHERIGRHAAQLIEDGATIQCGLGNSPEAVVRALRKHRRLGIHTGMFNDALMELVRCGAVDHSAKNYLPGKIIASHVLGSRKLYKFVDGNADIELHPSDWVNDPHRIARNDRMVAVNGAREIDLTGQVVRDSSGHRFYGGIGALQDFIRGAGRSKGGRPIIALTSTADADGRSRIVAGLESGSGVCTGRGDVHHVVTEYGVASLYGRSIRERVARLVEIAHPDHREALLAGAHGRGWLPKFFTMPGSGKEVDDVGSTWVEFQDPAFSPAAAPERHAGAAGVFLLARRGDGAAALRLSAGQDDGESAFKLAAVDQARDLALGIFAEEHGREEMRAIGRYYLEEGGKSAEVAFVVHEENRHMGIAGYLLGELAAVAKKRGIEEFWASVLPDNRAMAGLFLAVGAVESKSGTDDERELRMSVDRILKSRKKFLERKKIRRIER